MEHGQKHFNFRRTFVVERIQREVSRFESNLTCNNSVLHLVLPLLQINTNYETISTFLKASCSSNVSLLTLLCFPINSIFDTTTISTLKKTMAAQRPGRCSTLQLELTPQGKRSLVSNSGEKPRLELGVRSLALAPCEENPQFLSTS